jgi:Tfp pilus assembly protein PilE
MSPTLVTIAILAIVIIIVALAYILYRARFRITEITAKTGPLEMKMERTPTTDTSAEPSPPAQFSKEATDGASVENATIEASPDATASAKQKAEGPGSRLKDVDIRIK